MKHTQGKWYTNNDGDTIIVNVYKYVENGYITTIDGVNAEANAQRIVDCVNACEGINPKAVPDLLEACKEAVKLLRYQDIPHTGTIEGETYWDRRNKIEQAITKAEEK